MFRGRVDAVSGGAPVVSGFAAGGVAGGQTDTVFDDDGRSVAVYGPRSSSAGLAVTSAAYDASGNLVASTDANGNTSHQGFDAMGRLVSQTDPAGAVTGYGYDALGRLTSTQAPGKPAETVVYVNGNATASPATPAKVTVTRPGGVSAVTTYDSDGLPVGTAYSDSTPDVTYTFDAVGRLTGASGAVSTTRAYDSLGETLSVDRGGESVAYSYVRPGKIASVTYPNNQLVTRGYDAAGRWDSVTDWNAKTTTFSYDADGNVTDTTMANGTSVAREFDAEDQITKVTYGFGAIGLPVTYTRGAGGELSGGSQLTGTSSWAYDPAQQVTATTGPTGAYAFDPVDNPTTLNATAQTFDAGGELCWSGTGTGTCSSPPAGATTFTYDANGERTTGGSDTFACDASGAMATAVTPNDTATYTYAVDGLRTSKTVGSTTTDYAWDDTAGVPELIRDGGDFYVYGPDGLPVERVGTDPTRWLMCDVTGSVTASTKDNGDLASLHNYDAWGNTLTQAGDPISLGWQHQYQDPETGLYYLRARYYDPTTAQFLTPDPLFTVTGSRYGYADNDPVNGSDPSGLSWYNPCIGHTCASDVAKRGANDVYHPVRWIASRVVV